MKKKIGNLLFYLILTVMAVGAIGFGLSTSAEKSIFGFRFYEVLSGSMDPAISKGDLILVEMKKAEEVSPGDIVTVAVSDDGVTLTHRLVRSYEEDGSPLIVTKGDQNRYEDEPVMADNLIGKVRYRIPYVGAAVGFLKRYVLQILVGLAALYIIIKIIKIIKSGKEVKMPDTESQKGGF